MSSYIAEPRDDSDPVIKTSAMQAAITALYDTVNVWTNSNSFNEFYLQDTSLLTYANIDVFNGTLRVNGTAVGGGGGSLTVTEVDGSPSVTATTIKFANGSVTDNGSGVVTIGLVSNATHTGDVTGSTALTLATVNSNVGTFGSATQASSVTVNAKGLVTAASAVTITPAVGSITGLGTGVATALAVAVGSAGAPVVNSGVLGTPSSGTVTNLTGTASININGTVGATTPAAASVTTLTVSSTITYGSATSGQIKKHANGRGTEIVGGGSFGEVFSVGQIRCDGGFSTSTTDAGTSLLSGFIGKSDRAQGIGFPGDGSNGAYLEFYGQQSASESYASVLMGSWIPAGANAGLKIYGQKSAAIGLTVRGAASQSANLQEWQNSSGTVLSSVSASGYLSIGGGTAITKVLSATATLDFGSISANSYADLTITVTGAAVGDTVSIGVPNGSLLNDISFFGWVSATNTVTVRCSNVSSTTARDPASGTFRATVTQF